MRRQQATGPDEAGTCGRHVFAVACRRQGKASELGPDMSLSRQMWCQDKQTAARQLLTPIYGWCTEGFDTADLHEARALLEQLA
jgi:hypothetical protein